MKSVARFPLIVFLFSNGFLNVQGAEIAFQKAYATYLGGSAWEEAREVIPFADGSVLIGAQTSSSDMPTTEGVIQPAYAGDDPNLGHGGVYGGDCYVARLNPDGGSLQCATFFGGSRQERNVYGMELDSQGNIVITSGTRSRDLPTTPGCFQPRYGGGATDWFVAKLSGDLKKLLWCTYVGGSGDGMPRGGLTLDAEDHVYVVGSSASPNFPTTPGVVQRDLRGERDAAIVKLRPDGSGLVFATRLGGNSWDGLMGIRVDSRGNLYVAGHTRSTDFPGTAGAAQPEPGGMSDCYLAKLSADASNILYATYLGGSGNEFAEHQLYLATDGTILLPGSAGSADFPTTKGAFQRSLKGRTDGFLTKLSAGGKTFIFSTLLGGSGGEFTLQPRVGPAGNIYLVGQTESRDFPATETALQRKFAGGKNDGALYVLSPEGSKILYATYLGGSGDELIRGVSLGPRGEVYLVGYTTSEDFPVTAGAFQKEYRGKADTFVVKLVPMETGAPQDD